MKKIYSSLFAVALVTGVSAQQISKSNVKKTEIVKEITFEQTAKKNVQLNEKGAVLWSDDCSDVNDWVFTNTGSLAVNWALTTNVNDIPVSVLRPMGSATAANGYMFISSDANNTADNDGTFMVSQFTNATPIDLTGKNFVSLEFSSNYRWYYDTRGVRVSGNNGLSWTDYVITDLDGYPNLQNSENPDITRIDISSVAGGSNEVLVQFFYEDNDYWAWYWAVDDVKILENDANDIRVDKDFTADIDADFQYSQIPLTQARPLSFGLTVTNTGINTQDWSIAYDVMFGGSSVDAGNSAVSAGLLANTQDTIFHTTTYTPSALGVYTIDMEASIAVDDVPADNVVATQDLIEVTNDVWAHDNGVVERQYSQLFNGDSTAQFTIGNQFLPSVDTKIWTAEVGLATSVNSYGVGSLLFAQVYKWDGSAWVFLATSDEHEVKASDLGTVVSLGFSGGVDILAGDQIALVAGHYGGDITQRVRIAGGGRVSEQQIGFDGLGGAWGFSGGVEPPHVRMNINEDSYIALKVNENIGNVRVSQNFPNPFNGNTTVNYTLVSADEVMVEVTDVTGKVIEVINEGVRTAGSHVVTINSNKLAAGTYYYTVSTSNGKVTKSMNVTK